MAIDITYSCYGSNKLLWFTIVVYLFMVDISMVYSYYG